MPVQLDFTDAQRKRLRKLGCEPAQIVQLRRTLREIRRVLHRHPARNDVKETLETVAKHAEALLKELGRIAAHTNAARAAADAIIEDAYWTTFPDEAEPWSAQHMLPRLDAIGKGARAGIKSLATKPTRHRTASPLPIRRIDSALRDGWRDAHGTAKRPKQFNPTDDPHSTFREIVGICYVAAGARAGTDPLRAIRAHLGQRREQHKELRAIVEAAAAAPGKENRTHRKN